MLQFKVTIFKPCSGIYTCYAATIKKNTNPDNRDMHSKHYYDVRLFINDSLTDCITAYSSSNMKKCECYLNNFIERALKGYEIINLDTIIDKPYDFDFHCPPPCHPWDHHGPKPYHPVFCEDDIMKTMFDDHGNKLERPGPIPNMCKEIHPDPCMNGHMDNRPFDDPCDGKYGPHGPHDHHGPGPWMPREIAVSDPYTSICRVIPSYLDKILYQVTPLDERPGPHNHNIVIYYGNGGNSMGGSVITSMEELSETALADLKRLNGGPTYEGGSDVISIKSEVKPRVFPNDAYLVNMEQDSDWCFIMVPEKHYEDIKHFNWYMFDETTNKWNEDIEHHCQTGFTIQSDGHRYYYNAISLSGNYSLKFQMSQQPYPPYPPCPPHPPCPPPHPPFPPYPPIPPCPPPPKGQIVWVDIDAESELTSISLYEGIKDLYDYSTRKVLSKPILKTGNVTSLNGLEFNKVYTFVDNVSKIPCIYFKLIIEGRNTLLYTCETFDGIFTQSTIGYVNVVETIPIPEPPIVEG